MAVNHLSLKHYYDLVQSGKRLTMYNQLWAYILNHPRQCAYEIVRQFKHSNPNTIAPRLTEMRDMGFIRFTPPHDCYASPRQSHGVVIVEDKIFPAQGIKRPAKRPSPHCTTCACYPVTQPQLGQGVLL